MLSLTQQQKELLTQSYSAYQTTVASNIYEERTPSMLNGEIVSNSQSDNAAEYVDLKALTIERTRNILARKRKALARQIWWQKSKIIAAKNFLRRKRSRTVQSVEAKLPDIGKSIEDFVSQRNIGADAWRHTGVLTFDGNIKLLMVAFRSTSKKSTHTSSRTVQWSNFVLHAISVEGLLQTILEIAKVTTRRA